MYGIIKTLLKQEYNMQDTVLIESPFEERTRLGACCETRNVILGIAPNKFMIASEKNEEYKRKRFKEEDDIIKKFTLDSIYPLKSVNISIFKRTRRQSLKVVFNEMITRYFDLGGMPRRNIFWKLWCRHVNEIRKGSPMWPYETAKPSVTQIQNTQRWTDKYLYLGAKRHAEDQIRPIPIPGMGHAEDKLLYLKPQYFGCWGQTEHYIQCNEEGQAATHDYEDLTYTDDPNSNITYTSLMTTLGIIGQF